MKMLLRLPISVAGAVFLSLIVGEVNAKIISLPELEKSLQPADHISRPDTYFPKVVSLYPLLATNAEILTELASQNNYELVAMAAFIGLTNLDSAAALRVSLARFWTETNLYPVLDGVCLNYLTTIRDNKMFVKVFSNFASMRPRNIASASIAIYQIPSEVLLRWFRSDDSKSSIPSVKASVAEKILFDTPGVSGKQRRVLNKAIETSKNCPGEALVIYLIDSKSISIDPVVAVRNVLEDATVSRNSKIIICTHYRSKIDKLQVESLQVTQEEKQDIKRWLKR